MKPGSNVRTVAAVFAVAVIAAMGCVLLYALMPRPKRFNYDHDRPLLRDAEALFKDPQTDLQFVPPQDWSMQARSFDAPKHRPERMLVKYKRVKADQPEAWLRVRVFDAPEDQSPGEFLRRRKAPEEGMKPAKEVEEKLQVAGQPAARVMYAGPFDPDGSGAHDFTCEIIALRRGEQFFVFAGTYLTTDIQARQQIHTAFESIAFGK
jgi:hypothetical protein